MAAINASDVYFGTYARFKTTDKTAGAALAGPDNAVGDIGSIAFDLDERKREQAWLVNPYGHRMGFLDPNATHKLAVLAAKGWELRYVLSFTAYSDKPEPTYWGQVALIAYAPQHKDTFETFLKTFSHYAAEGSRPDPELGLAGVSQVLANPSAWTPSNKVKIPSSSQGTTILKDHRSMHDKLLDKGRSKNPGCYLIAWAFIFAVIGLVAWMLHAMGIF